jgi:Phage tail protein.
VSFISEYFIYDGINSTDYGVYLVKIDNAFIRTPFGYNREIVEEQIPRRDKPYFFRLQTKPLQFDITIALIDELWTIERRMQIIEWLFQDDYKPFISGDNLDVIYYCMPVGDPERFDTSLNEGYANLTMRCNSPYAYSPTYIVNYYSGQSTNPIVLENISNVQRYNYPEIEIELLSGTGFSISNLTDGNRTLSFDNLQSGEIIYINNERKQIISSLPNTYRYSNSNKTWFRLVRGYNSVQITGDVNVSFRTVYPIAL